MASNTPLCSCNESQVAWKSVTEPSDFFLLFQSRYEWSLNPAFRFSIFLIDSSNQVGVFSLIISFHCFTLTILFHACTCVHKVVIHKQNSQYTAVSFDSFIVLKSSTGSLPSSPLFLVSTTGFFWTKIRQSWLESVFKYSAINVNLRTGWKFPKIETFVE